ncbi:hypothetical protein VDG1235_2947 [Verrucomicrobiia bacterium DG1235]|nr:hypothetical protein VDG1235_2947 [Verrucomicrobiae bacterium DG1235]
MDADWAVCGLEAFEGESDDSGGVGWDLLMKLSVDFSCGRTRAERPYDLGKRGRMGLGRWLASGIWVF